MEVLSNSLAETKKFAQVLALKLRAGDVLALHGDLGSGKTTFVGFLVAALGSIARVQSPTFVLLRKYGGGRLNVNHLDLYRIGSEAEVVDLGLDELVWEPNAITVIEWPEVATNFLPPTTMHVHFEYKSENERRIYVQNLS